MSTRDVFVGVNQLGAFAFFASPARRWDSDGDAVRRDIFRHDGVGADRRVVTDRDRPEHLRTSADGDVVAHGGVTLGLRKHLTAQSHAVIEHDAVANFGGFADDDAHPVVDEKPASNRRAGVDLDSCHKPGELREYAGGAFPATFPPTVRYSVRPNRVKT